MARIYVASSWRNEHQPDVVRALIRAGHSVYDFREPCPGNCGFAWSAIDPKWKDWSVAQYAEALNHPVAQQGFALDMAALALADACVLVMPSGRSAHLEAGYAIGAGKPTAILLSAGEPELMYRMAARLCTSIDQVVHWSLSEVGRG